MAPAQAEAIARINLVRWNRMTLCAVRRYKKEEQHEDDQKHHCPTRERTESAIHAITPSLFNSLNA